MKYFIKVMNTFVSVEARYEFLQNCLKPFRVKTAKGIKFWVDLDQDILEKRIQRNPQLSKEAVEYIYSGKDFYENILALRCIQLNALTVSINNKGYLFCGLSSTQKTEITEALRKHFTSFKLISDETIMLRVDDKKTYLFATPWTSKIIPESTKSIILKKIFVLDTDKIQDYMEMLVKYETIKSFAVMPESANGIGTLSDSIKLLISKHKLNNLAENYSIDEITNLIAEDDKKK